MLYAIKELWEFDNPRDEAKKIKLPKRQKDVLDWRMHNYMY